MDTKSTSRWPTIPVADWQDSRDTLHLYAQVVGKIRLANEPLVNHWWNVPLYLTVRGLTTSLMPHPTGPAFAYPEPPGYRDAVIAPAGARWDDDLAEFIFPYELVRTAADPDAVLLEFLQFTYEAVASTADWDDDALDRPNGANGHG